tara:strand:- start:68037 stop:70058 length:2022 start_codon:yes stop_codon:yes gene_type:complete
MMTNTDSSIYFFQKAKVYSDEFPHPLNLFKKGLAIKNIGLGYFFKEEYEKAIKYLDSASIISQQLLQIQNEKYEKKSLLLNAVIKTNKGLVYYRLSQYDKAIENYYEALSIDIKIKDYAGQAADFTNLGLAYSEIEEFNKSLDYFYQSLTIHTKLGNKRGQGRIYGNLSVVYLKLKNYSKALLYAKKALEIDSTINNTRAMMFHYTQIGRAYFGLNKYDLALKYFNQSLQLNKEIGFKTIESVNLFYIGEIYLKQNQYIKAEKNYLIAEQSLKKIGDKSHLADIYKSLSELYSIKGNCEKSFYYYKLKTAFKDSLINDKIKLSVLKDEIKYDFQKKQFLDSLKFAEKEKIDKLIISNQKAELSAKKQQQAFISSLLIIILIFSVFIFNRLQVTRKQKNIIEEQKKIVDRQKQLVEEKNKEITASIAYAKRIQYAILPPQKLLSTLLPNSFVLYKPKDIVSGDFYWLEQNKDKDIVLFAAADCTGHGVPGAMVSVVCNNGLNRAVREHSITIPGEILNKAREIILQEFEKSEENVQDGMDISLCALNKNTGELKWAGANNPLYIIRSENQKEYKLLEFKPDKQPVGKTDNPKPFTTHSIQLQKGDTIYLFTDGFADQFGGEKGKKLKYKRFKELLLEIQNLSMNEQKEFLNNFFTQWKGNLEQIDDVCILGVRV